MKKKYLFTVKQLKFYILNWLNHIKELDLAMSIQTDTSRLDQFYQAELEQKINEGLERVEKNPNFQNKDYSYSSTRKHNTPLVAIKIFENFKRPGELKEQSLKVASYHNPLMLRSFCFYTREDAVSKIKKLLEKFFKERSQENIPGPCKLNIDVSFEDGAIFFRNRIDERLV